MSKDNDTEEFEPRPADESDAPLAPVEPSATSWSASQEGLVPDPAPLTDEPAPAHAPVDPAVGWLLRVALGLIVVLLATTGALVYYLNTLNRAPRTSAERDIITWETATIETPKNADAWSRLAYAYAVAKRYDEALDTVKEGAKRTKEPLLTLVKADILRSAGRFAEAKDAYDVSVRELKRVAAETKKRREKLRVTVNSPDEGMSRALAGRAVTLHELGDTDVAIKDLEEALKIEPQQSTLWVLLGDYYREVGTKDKAKTAYSTALKYIPDYAEALAGLDALEKDAQ